METELNHTDEDLEIKRLVEEVFRIYGYDFRNYAEASLRRRIVRAKELFGFSRVGEIEARIQSDRAFFQRLLSELTVSVSEMFRDPEVYRSLADEVLPVLATYPSIRIWHAGCSTGEEVYSMAILLKEAGLLDRSTLYATDIDPLALQKAKAGVFPASAMQKSTENYLKAGRREEFGSYYTADYGMAIIDRSLKQNVVFAEHNLATDSTFSEVHLVVCRNVFIYFDKVMQNRALKVFYESLIFKGFLCIGSKESLEFTDYRDVFGKLNDASRIFQKSEAS